MSQKNLRRKRQPAARAMPVETVQTRFRSSRVSQQKTTALDQNEIIKTRYSKVYTRSPKSSPKCKERQNLETPEIESNKEFYPNKLKRIFEKKEIVLKPKLSYKLVGGLSSINKRKLRKPTKEPIHGRQHLEFPEELTEKTHNTNSKIIDLICLDDSDSLDEEDLMEILTCPSPVWWEDPPDESFDEDPISIKINNKDYNIKIKEQNVNFDIEKDNNFHQKAQDKNIASQVNNISKEDNNFVARRIKLESLLGNIKNKKSNDDKIENTNSIISSPELRWQKKSSDSLGEEVLDSEILKTLENINIPTEKPKEEPTTVYLNDTSNPPETSNESIIESRLITNKPKTSNIKSVKGLTIKKCDIKQFKPKLGNKKAGDRRVQSIEEMERNKMLFMRTWSGQCDLKVLGNVSKESDKNQGQFKPNQIDKVTGITIKNFDPNIMIKKVKKRSRKKNDKKARNIPKKVTTQNKTSANSNADDQITVYKIVSEQEVEENNDNKIESKTYNSQMNSYYNQCKNINKCKPDNKLICDSDKESMCNNNQIKSIPVSNNETVKYCLQCSSIFDNDICNYCALKSNGDTKQTINKKTEAS